MKSLLSLIFFTASVGVLSAQTISESVEHLRKKYKSNQSISFDFVREYELGSTDTSYYLSVDVYNRNLELESVSLGLTRINRAASSHLKDESRLSADLNYDIIRSAAYVEMNRAEFNEFVTCANEVFVFMKVKKSYGEDELNTSAMCSKYGLTLGAEYYSIDGFREKLNFFLSVEDTVFSITEERFNEIANYLMSVKNKWDNIDSRDSRS